MNIRFIEATPLNIRNGNAVTSERWRNFFRELGHRVSSSREPGNGYCDILVAFNASKNRQAIQEASKIGNAGRIVICLTGTDLYVDLKKDPAVLDVLHLADRLVVLQPMALRELPPSLQRKTVVIHQSALRPGFQVSKDPGHFDVCVIAHLREVKDPLRAAKAARLLPARSRIRVSLIGAALSDELADEARREEEENPRFHWLGELDGDNTAINLLRSRLMVISSLHEGGANVISEAVVSGIPVIGSDIPCTRGLLGDDYPGLFPARDSAKLAELLFRAETDTAYYDMLAARCSREAHKFAPSREKEQLKLLLQGMFHDM